MIGVCELTAHPGNVRGDLDLTPEFCASVAQAGVRIPLQVTVTADGGYRVVEGHRRLAAAVKAGLETVPCDLDTSLGDDEAGQYLDMLLANSDAYRKNFVPIEEAAALFAAHEAGASKTRLRRTTGRKADEIRTALKAAQVSPQTRDAAGELAPQLTLHELALLAEFDNDPDAVAKLLEAMNGGYSSVDYVAERIRQDRAEAAEHERLIGELTAAGVQVTTDLPPGAVRLSELLHDGEDLTPEAHAACPGRGAFFPSWNLLRAVHYCTGPAEHGHVTRSSLLARPPATGAGAAEAGVPAPGAPPVPPAEQPPDPARKLVIEGNKAWRAAAEVRKRWLADTLFARRSAPREAAPFIARQLLTMPDPLRSGLALAPHRQRLTEITRQTATRWLEICDTTAAARLPLLMLAPIATAYEQAMTEGEGTNTWRTDRYSPCPRTEAGHYLAFLASAGYQLSSIEQAVADGTPWTGDSPAEPLPYDSGTAGPGDEPGPAGQPGAGESAAGDADLPVPDTEPGDTEPGYTDGITGQAAA
jgi:ParB family chromosome partitioning protein